MNFNLYGDAAWAAKQCCLEMATGRSRGGHSRNTACGAVASHGPLRRWTLGRYLPCARRYDAAHDEARLAGTTPMAMARSVRYQP
jgi:hypothetical protein